jgi:PAS domain S-box-containing protein
MSSPGDGSSLSARSLNIRFIIDRIPAFTWSAHADGSVEFVNQRWREYAGLSAEESQGWGWQIAIHPEELPSLMRKWRELLISGEPGEIEARMRRHDGVFCWFLIRFERRRCLSIGEYSVRGSSQRTPLRMKNGRKSSRSFKDGSDFLRTIAPYQKVTSSEASILGSCTVGVPLSI